MYYRPPARLASTTLNTARLVETACPSQWTNLVVKLTTTSCPAPPRVLMIQMSSMKCVCMPTLLRHTTKPNYQPVRVTPRLPRPSPTTQRAPLRYGVRCKTDRNRICWRHRPNCHHISSNLTRLMTKKEDLDAANALSCKSRITPACRPNYIHLAIERMLNIRVRLLHMTPDLTSTTNYSQAYFLRGLHIFSPSVSSFSITKARFSLLPPAYTLFNHPPGCILLNSFPSSSVLYRPAISIITFISVVLPYLDRTHQALAFSLALYDILILFVLSEYPPSKYNTYVI